MERAVRWFSLAVRRYPAAIAAGTMIVCGVLAFGVTRLEFQTGQDTLIDPSSGVAQDSERFQRQFGGDYLLVLFETPSDDPSILQLFTPQNQERLRQLEEELRASGDYHSVITPLLILELATTQVETRMREEPLRLARAQDEAAAAARADAAARGEDEDQQEAAAEAARQRVADEFRERFGADARRFAEAGEASLDNPAFVEFVLLDADGEIRRELSGVFPDKRHALMIARPQGNLSIDEGSAVAADLVERVGGYEFDGVTALVSGPALLIKTINDQMRESLVIMAVFAVVIMSAVLFLVFRARWRLLSLPAVLVGCVAAFGLMGFAGIPLTMVTISGLPILIGLGVDFAVQVHSRIEEETFATESAEAGVERASLALGPALFAAAVAACAGFLVLHLSEVPMIRDFGSMLAVGAAIVFVVGTLLIACVVFLRERTRIGPREEVTSRVQVERLVGGLTARTVGRLVPIALIAALIAVAGLYAGRQIGTESDPERFVPQDSEVLKDLRYVRDVTGSTSELNLLIEIDASVDGAPETVIDDDVLAWMIGYEDTLLREHPELRRSSSIASLTRSLTGGEPTRAAAEQAIEAAPEGLVDSVVSDDLRVASITFAISGGDSLNERKRLNEAILAAAEPPAGVTVAPAGIAVVGIASVDALNANRDLMSFVALIAIFVVLLLFFRHPVKAVAPLLPVVLALGASAMIIYVSGMEYSPLTSISGPLIIAMGTEFSVLLMARYFEERSHGLDARAAMSRASLRIGRAITASGLTVMGGFVVLAFSGFPLLDNFGRVTALNIGISLVSTLVLLPPLLVWADEERGFMGVAARAAE